LSLKRTFFVGKPADEQMRSPPRLLVYFGVLRIEPEATVGFFARVEFAIDFFVYFGVLRIEPEATVGFFARVEFAIDFFCIPQETQVCLEK